MTPSDLKRFFRAFTQGDPDKCWEWQATRASTGYGFIWINRKYHGAHRISWIVFNGPIPEGLWVLHHCDNPSCVNPNHLFIGTEADNTHDMIKKKRNAFGERHWSRLHPELVPRGENNGMRKHPESVQRGEIAVNHKLKESDVIDIKQRLAAGSHGIGSELAREYGVTETKISQIKKGKAWAHVTSHAAVRPQSEESKS